MGTTLSRSSTINCIAQIHCEEGRMGKNISTPVAAIAIAVVVLLAGGLLWFKSHKKGGSSGGEMTQEMKAKMQENMQKMKGGQPEQPSMPQVPPR